MHQHNHAADKREKRGAEHRDLRPAQLVEGRLRFDAGRQQAGFETLHGLHPLRRTVAGGTFVRSGRDQAAAVVALHPVIP